MAVSTAGGLPIHKFVAVPNFNLEGEDALFPPLTIKLPDGLELTMWPRQAKRNAWGKVVIPGETEAEVWVRMAHALKTHDFTALSRVYQVPQNTVTVEPLRIKSEPSKPRGRPSQKKKPEEGILILDKVFNGDHK